MIGGELLAYDFRGNPVRVVVVDGEPMLVATDTCRVLDLRDTSSAMRMVDDEDKRRIRRSDTPHFFRGIAPQVQELVLVSESGLYALVFWSRKPEARAFRRWVTHEVLPAIRRTGAYGRQHEIPQSFADALELAARQAREIEAARAEVAELRPAATLWQVWVDTGVSMDVGTAAKYLKQQGIDTGRTRLYALLRSDEFRWVFKRSCEPMGDAIDAGMVQIEAGKKYRRGEGEPDEFGGPRTRITPAGLHRLTDHYGVQFDPGTVSRLLDEERSERGRAA